MKTKQFVLALLALRFFAANIVSAAEPLRGENACDPTKVVGHENCTKCHKGEMEVWKQHPHFATFDQLHRKPEAKEIAQRMGETSIKRSKLCVNCHYTLQGEAGQEKAVAGVSCESCHNAAADWIKVHNDYGGPNVTKAMEPPAHKKLRLETSIAKGMNNPVNIYLLAQQCYSCHTVPSEELVNKGKHKAGTEAFELVAWSQGNKTRHNFVSSDGKANAVSPPERLRVMYVVGAMVDLEYSLKAVAKAKEKATYGITSAKRVAALKQRLEAIQAAISHPLVGEALTAVGNVKLKINNEVPLVEAAELVSAAARKFAEQVDGKKLTAIDAMLPQPGQYKN